jgi:hypothetical protein
MIAEGTWAVLKQIHFITGCSYWAAREYLDAAGFIHANGHGLPKKAHVNRSSSKLPICEACSGGDHDIRLNRISIRADGHPPGELLLLFEPASKMLRGRYWLSEGFNEYERLSQFLYDNSRTVHAVTDRAQIRCLLLNGLKPRKQVLKKSFTDESSKKIKVEFSFAVDTRDGKSAVKSEPIDLTGIVRTDPGQLIATLLNQYNAPKGIILSSSGWLGRRGCVEIQHPLHALVARGIKRHVARRMLRYRKSRLFDFDPKTRRWHERACSQHDTRRSLRSSKAGPSSMR